MGTDLYRDGVARLEAGDGKEAKRLLEAALHEAPGDAGVMHALSRALEVVGERARAEELLELVHAKAPTEPGPACDLAIALLERGEDARAAQVLAPVLEAHPDHPRANLDLALALAKTEPERAKVHAQRAGRSSNAEEREQAAALERVLSGQAP
ncbi:tetratricopeptide repeat protein [Myxococcus qinghaiensis]|uniref:tetratricopeptide repeat protein n=1 Tax=Myxococcus qinghaiensis TaxID=2906758 RepID=UPI0020A717AC|nr:tetratricopeptide repeat protein [Myxococcus qinghaiensis]MCP3164201.1 tetratricopeptide repeat protein [Myxococcus qinghaiensis]